MLKTDELYDTDLTDEAWALVAPLLPAARPGGRPRTTNLRAVKVRIAAGRAACPSVVIMDAQSVKTTERGDTRGFDAHKRGRGRKRRILVDTLGLPIASRVEPADTSDRRGGARLVAGLAPLFPRIHTVIADAGHESRKLARELMRQDGWTLQIVKRRQRLQDHWAYVDR